MKKLYETTEAEIELQAARQRISAMPAGASVFAYFSCLRHHFRG